MVTTKILLGESTILAGIAGSLVGVVLCTGVSGSIVAVVEGVSVCVGGTVIGSSIYNLPYHLKYGLLIASICGSIVGMCAGAIINDSDSLSYDFYDSSST